MEKALGIFNNIFLIISIMAVVLATINYVINVYNKSELAAKSKVSHIRCFKPTVFSMNDKKYYIILAITALVGIGIRVWQFGSVPGGFNQDGAMAAVDGLAIANHGTDRFGTWMPAHLYAWGYGQMSSLLSYLIAIFVKLFGLNPVTARLPQLIMSIAGGAFFYLFIKDIFGKNAGLIAAIFVAINPWHLVQSRWALDCNLLPHFFMGGLYFLNKGLTKRRRYTFISMIFFALSMYCYGIALYTVPVFLVATCIYYMIKKRLNWKDVLISAGIYLAISWPFLLTMAINFFKWDTIELPFVTIQHFSGSVRSNDILLFSAEPLKQLGLNFKSLLNTTLYQKKDLPWNDIAGFGTMFLFTMPFFFAGIIEFFRHKTDGAKGLVLLALLTGVWAGLFTNGVNVNRINIVYYGIMMFVVLGIYFTIKEIKYTKWTSLCMYVIAGVLLVTTYFTSYADMIKGQFYYGFGDAVITVNNAETEKVYVTADAQGKGYTGTSEILTQFYDKTDAEYFQGKTNENNGKDLLPYKERFKYVSMSPDIVQRAENEDAAFVIMKSDKQYFDNTLYDIEEFGNFCAVIKNRLGDV